MINARTAERGSRKADVVRRTKDTPRDLPAIFGCRLPTISQIQFRIAFGLGRRR